MRELTVALAGNPNTGKSTIFNALTGSTQRVGNWPGKTVKKREGLWRYDGREYTIIDLPGTYSLSAYSPEEIIARDFIVEERPDAVVVVVDAANLERNLYLAVQILEMRGGAVVALNMTDTADKRGLAIDIPTLSGGLGVEVVPLVARERRGLPALQATIAAVATRDASDRASPGSEP